MKRYGTPPTEEQLVEAAEMRAAGFRWESVGEKLRKAAETVRRWPRRYPERWEQAMQKAEMRQAVDVQSESVVVLRGLARNSDDEKVKLQAAKAIIHMRLGLGKLLNTPAGRSLAPQDKSQLISELLERYSDDHFQQLADEGSALRNQRAEPGGTARERCDARAEDAPAASAV